MRAPLWLDVQSHGSKVTAELARCRNCGEIKVSSNPCGFDHLAAVIQFRDVLESQVIPQSAESVGYRNARALPPDSTTRPTS